MFNNPFAGKHPQHIADEVFGFVNSLLDMAQGFVEEATDFVNDVEAKTRSDLASKGFTRPADEAKPQGFNTTGPVSKEEEKPEPDQLEKREAIVEWRKSLGLSEGTTEYWLKGEKDGGPTPDMVNLMYKSLPEQFKR